MKPLSSSRTLLAFMLLFGVGIFLSSMRSSANPTDEWPQWLGPNRDGISTATGLLKSWPESGPKILWRIPLGEGYGGIAVAQGRALAMFSQGPDEFLICLEAATGKEAWRVRMDSTYKDTNGNGPRSTPTIENGVVYALGGRGQFMAVQLKDGKKIWGHDVRREFNSFGPSDGGFATSPLIEGEKLLLEAGGAGHAFMAFDKKTGKVLWHVESDSSAFSSPVAINFNGTRQIIFFSALGGVALAPENGKVYWRMPWITSYNVNAATPLFIPPDRVFLSSGYDVGAVMLRLRPQGDASTAEELWRSKSFQNIWATSIVRGEFMYGFDKGTLKCINLNTAEEKWAQRGFGTGALLFADGHLIVLGDKGKLALVEATPAAFVEKASAQIMEGRCLTVPALARGKLFVRNAKEMVCVNLMN